MIARSAAGPDSLGTDHIDAGLRMVLVEAMPVYRCITPAGSLALSQRQAIAKAFTDIHCDSTGAPRSFVHVFFADHDGQADRPSYYMAGNNRAGRPREVRDALLSSLCDALASIAEVPRTSVDGHIAESPASWAMEGGEILPEPGEEGPTWFGEHAAASS